MLNCNKRHVQSRKRPAYNGQQNLLLDASSLHLQCSTVLYFNLVLPVMYNIENKNVNM